ncbi:hypothetical protein CALCODRAFT_51529 [Calocera cornea HHB12733]|uniref:Uncharacterized protein n=1 Tax=Calocera cornea HHB12733 TaxID=1353952 RepID=A0A165DSG3_9BASI|nr:hypothetical protein CALCODRAFT_51529 [Calocera cornea HHB12733]
MTLRVLGGMLSGVGGCARRVTFARVQFSLLAAFVSAPLCSIRLCGADSAAQLARAGLWQPRRRALGHPPHPLSAHSGNPSPRESLRDSWEAPTQHSDWLCRLKNTRFRRNPTKPTVVIGRKEGIRYRAGWTGRQTGRRLTKGPRTPALMEAASGLISPPPSVKHTPKAVRHQKLMEISESLGVRQGCDEGSRRKGRGRRKPTGCCDEDEMWRDACETKRDYPLRPSWHWHGTAVGPFVWCFFSRARPRLRQPGKGVPANRLQPRPARANPRCDGTHLTQLGNMGKYEPSHPLTLPRSPV